MSGFNSSAPGSGAATEPLGLTVHAMPSPHVNDPTRRTAYGRLKMLGVLAVCAAPVIASYLTYFVIRPQTRTNYSTLITPPRALPGTLSLKSLGGDPVKPSSLRGQWLLVVVADAACDATCERHLYVQRQLHETLGGQKDRLDKIWLITDDGMPPVAVVRAIAQGAPVNMLRVPRSELAQWLTPADRHTLAQHLFVVDPMGNWMMRTPVDTDPSKLKRDLDRLLRASNSWDRPGR